MVQEVLIRLLVAGGLIALAVMAAVLLRHSLDRFHTLLCRTPVGRRIVLGLFLAVCIAYGGSKNTSTNEGNAASSSFPTNLPTTVNLNLNLQPQPSCHPSVTPEDIACGWQLWEVRTNAAVSYAMPEGAALATNWWMRGAYEDVRREPLPFAFPLASNACDSVWAFTWGKIRPRLRDASNEIVAVGAPMAAVPGVSRFWTAMSTNDSYLLTWENFTLGRVEKSVVDSDCAAGMPRQRWVSAQIELFATGDFIIRSNEIERVCRRIDPEDWDGDGWQNDDDCSPYDWDESWDDFWQELPEGANTNAYCWIDVRCNYSSWVSFMGDGESDLSDPSFTALAGRTYRVTLLIGKTYDIASAHPLTVVGRSSDDIEVEGDGTCDLTVVWPVDLYALESNGRGFKMIARPSGLGGRYTWTSSCCTIYGENDVFRYGCVSNCNCTGCTASGYYAYEGYRLFVEGGWCGCSEYDDDPNENSPGVSVSFSKSVIFLEDAYWNTPTNEVPWQSTDTLLTCDASGGPNGGSVTFSISGGTNLIQYTGQPLPYSRSLAPNETLHFVNRYKAVAESAAANDIVVTASFVENATGWSDEAEATATAVRVEVRPVMCAPANDCDYRHGFGIGEVVRCEFTPKTAPVSWVSNGQGVFTRLTSEARYQCPLHNEIRGFKIAGLGAEYVPNTWVVEPNAVLARDVSYASQGVLPGQAGGVLLKLSLHALPLDVSFLYVKMEEVPDAGGSHSGYFADSFFMDEWYHGRDQKAGIWHSVTGDNMFLEDDAGFETSLPQLDAQGQVSTSGTCGWTAGMLSWEVPCGWADQGVSDDGDPVGTFAADQLQVMTIDGAGNCEVRKHSNSVRRTIDGHVYLNGVLVQ